jgi:Fe-S-cluster containining protein
MQNLDQNALEKAVLAVYAEADCDISSRKPICRNSGRCCRFESYGHLLYVTAVELIAFSGVQKRSETEKPVSAQPGRVVSLHQFFGGEKVEGCPYQIGGMCTAREARPLGCRIYFCDENAQHWQNEVYEKYHTKLKDLHETFGLPYRYVEWRAGLREIMQNENNETNKNGDSE